METITLDPVIAPESYSPVPSLVKKENGFIKMKIESLRKKETKMKIAVLKISGKAINEVLTSETWINSLKKIRNNYDGLVIVHGAGKGITEWSAALGHEARFVDGQRVTTPEVMDVVAAVQAGVLNAKIVSRLVTSNLNAVGLTGIDRGSFEAENVNKDLGFVGVPRVVGSVDWISDMINNNIVPVFSSICRDNKGNLMNVNADIFTETLAAAINAESVFFVSDIQGVKLGGDYKNCINETEILNGILTGEITDGMIPKLQSCVELLSKGIAKIWIGSKNLEDVFNDNCKQSQNGTWIVLSA